MNINPRNITILTEKQAYHELAKIGCDSAGINIMAPKALFKTVKIEGVPVKEANLLKQTFLAKGGEVAVARGAADLSVETTDVLICATLKQYRLAIAQLKLQPWGLPRVALSLDKLLSDCLRFPNREYKWSDRKLDIRPGSTLVMGILNLTPDSFSDGGRYNRLDAALRRLEEMIESGADIIDVGAESTRPYGGTQPISAEEEMERLLPLLEQILAVSTVPVSVDTYKAEVARAALKLGAHMINDVWGLQRDSGMAKVVAEFDVPVVIMHNKEQAVYNQDIMAEIVGFLKSSIEIGLKAGIDINKFIIDPGIGFAKTPDHNLEIMSRLEELQSLGCPILLGVSRKRFIGEVLNLPVEDRVEGTAAAVAVGITKGVNIVRVHDVQEMVRVSKMTDAMMRRDLHE